MGDFHEHLPHLNRDCQFLPALPDKSLLLGLPRLHLTAYELPQKPPGLVEPDASKS